MGRLQPEHPPLPFPQSSQGSYLPSLPPVPSGSSLRIWARGASLGLIYGNLPRTCWGADRGPTRAGDDVTRRRWDKDWTAVWGRAPSLGSHPNSLWLWVLDLPVLPGATQTYPKETSAPQGMVLYSFSCHSHSVFIETFSLQTRR